MAENEGIEIPVTLSLGQLKKQIREIKSELAAATDPEEMARLSEKAGELQDNLMRVNEQAAVFASGSKFEQANNALGLMNSQLMNLDFEGAAESALLLQNRVMSITPEEVTKQMKGLTTVFSVMGKVGGQAITGLLKNIGQMAKAFISFGASLMANPIFLIAAAIIAIVGIIALLLNKLGLLKPVLKAIGGFFKMIGDAIDWVIQQIKDFLDWIGLTDYAAEDSAKKHTKAAEAKADAYEESGKRITASLDHEIRMTQLSGKSTVKLEIEKQQVIHKTNQLRYNALMAKYKENLLTEEMDEEELKELKKNLKEKKAAILESTREIQYIKAKDRIDTQKKSEEEAKEQTEKAKANAKEAAANAKQWRADRLAAERQYQDALLGLMEDGKEKDLAVEKERFKRQLEDLARNEKLTADEKKKIKAAYLQEEQQTLNAINQKYADKEKEDAVKQAVVLAEIEASKNPKSLESKLKVLDAQEKAEIFGKELTEAEKLAIENKYNEQRAKTAEQFGAEQIARELEKTKNLAELALLQNENDLGAQLALLEAQKQIELSNKELTEEQKSLIEEKYRKARTEAEKAEAEKRKKIEAEVAKATETGLEALIQLNDFVFNLRSKRMKEGSAEEQKAAKQRFEINKKLQVAQATIQGIQATIAAYSSAAAIPVIGAVAAPIAAAAAALTALNNINKIKSAKFEGGTSSASSATAPASLPSQSENTSAPALNMYGSAYGNNNTQEGQNQNLNVTIQNNISETEITKTQNKVSSYESAATLNG